ncbi:hypothetical protein RHSIM_Rhsim01G0052000 [Rhododendron simsii]|uniref:Uncharacterized protein n=1 Tax=Rhododendron simsii TaxID=118357 RepID=A0A834HFG8_RHOSS|nr:hypothetical protein RHSIM_Rhsim01G0052000 [Rhododendron simsii]
MSTKFLLVLLLAVVAVTTSSLADHHKPPTNPGHKPPAVEVEDENNGIEEDVKSRRSLAGERDPYVDVIDYAPAHATPPIHN